MSIGQAASDSDLPKTGEVTSLSPREIGKFGRWFKIAITSLLPAAFAVCILLRIDNLVYVCGVTILAQIFGLIPYWRYREQSLSPPLTQHPAPEAAKAQTASSRQ